jgi:hypothetical protein
MARPDIFLLQQSAIWVQADFMEYRGVRYAIRLGITRGQWQVAVYLPDKELPKETTVVGTRQAAKIAATKIINAGLKKRPRKHLL